MSDAELYDRLRAVIDPILDEHLGDAETLIRAAREEGRRAGYANGYRVGHTEGVESMRAAAEADALQHRREGWAAAVAELWDGREAAALAISRYDYDHMLSANGEVSGYQRGEADAAVAALVDHLAAQAARKGHRHEQLRTVRSIVHRMRRRHGD